MLLRIFLVFVLASAVMAQPTLNPWEDETPPASPKEFHAQEARRYADLRRALEESPLLSTQADYDALYYDLTLDLRDFAGETIYGNVRILARSRANDLDELVLDLCSTLTVDSVVAAGMLLSYSSEDNVLTVELERVYTMDETVDARVYYHGTPCQTSLYESFSYYNRPVGPRYAPSIATLSEPTGARDWWPCKDDPSDKADSVRVSMIVADTITATSNGVLESVTPLPPSSQMFTWVERHPISTYLVCVSATNYAHYREWYVAQNGDSVPLDHYPYPERLTQAQVSWSRLPEMMTFLAGIFGEYPFADEKYGQTMFNWGGAMEHQCNTSYGRSITNGYHTYDYIVVHELGHQWFGDDVTLGTWPDIWLNEGFASYTEALWYEHLNGPSGLQDYQTSNWGNDVVDPSGPVYNPTDLFSSNTVYDKGSWILHILRGVIRDDSLFFAALGEYKLRHAYGNAITTEFLADISDVVGYDVTPYLYAYLYRTNRPYFAVSFGTGTVHSMQETVVRIRQTQTDPDTTFRTRLDLRLTSDQNEYITRVENGEWDERYLFNLGFEPTTLEVDPWDWVLKEVTDESLPLTILSETLTGGTREDSYADSLTAIGGFGGQQTWSVVDGSLPDGIVLQPEGNLSGVPQESGTFSFLAHVEDLSGGEDEAWLSVEIAEPLVAPTDVTASLWGTDSVMIRWSSVALADSYRVFRSLNVGSDDLTWLLTTADTFAVDTLAPTSIDPSVVVRRFYVVTSQENE